VCEPDLDPHLRVGPLERLLAQVLEVLVLLVLVRHLRDVGVVDFQPVLPTGRETYLTTGKFCFANLVERWFIAKFACLILL
jgi:hypothetical protein